MTAITDLHLAALPTLRALFAADPQRATRDRLKLGPVLVDFSKQRLSAQSYALLEQVADQLNLPASIAAMFNGEVCNASEGRQVLHGLLRTPHAKVPQNLLASYQEMQASFALMQRVCDAVHHNHAHELGLVQPKTIVNIGIGGSDLGPRLAIEALSYQRMPGIDVKFITNVDAHYHEQLLQKLDPDHTIFVIVSKSFATQETKLNAERARAWIAEHYRYRCLEPQFDRHFIAVSSNVAAAKSFGINPALVIGMSEAVGGRFSLWSSVGLSIALAIGWEQFQQLLAGAHLADQNYRNANYADNLSIRLAMVEYFNRRHLNHASRCVVSYDDRLRRLPEFLQQLEMESNGKSVAPDGSSLERESAPVVWGGVGTNVQHAFFQAIHQGTTVVPVDFVGVKQPAHDQKALHRATLANLLAQSAALLRGKDFDSALADTEHADPAQRETIAKQRVFSGNRPSTTFLMDALTPESMGVLLAVLENKTHALSVFWGVNAFDQWGVELGKVLANQILPAIEGSSELAAFDSSTQGLLEALRS